MKYAIVLFLGFTILSCNVKKEWDTNLEWVKIPKGDSVRTRLITFYDENYKDTVIAVFPGEDNRLIMDTFVPPEMSVENYPKKEPHTLDIRLNPGKNIVLNQSFRHGDVLTKLFGKNTYFIYSDGESKDSTLVVGWVCSTCKEDSLPYLGDKNLGKVFPGKEINTTFIHSDYLFKLKKSDYRLVSLVTYPNDRSISFTGRFSGGVMGYALFVKWGNQYVLQAFDPAVGIYGNFNAPADPELRIAYEQLFLIYTCCNGGAGAPYTSIVDVLTFQNKQMHKIAHEEFISVGNSALGLWETQYQFFKEKTDLFPGIKIITSGYFTGIGSTLETYPYVFTGAPDEFKQRCVHADVFKKPFSFVYERKLRLSHGNKREESLKFKELKGKWVTHTITEQ